MIVVNCERKNGIIERIVVFGHSGYASKGEDIVCSAVSGIINGTANFIYENYPSSSEISFSSARVNIKAIELSNNDLQLCLRLMLYQLKNIEKGYSEYLKIDERSIIKDISGSFTVT